MTVWILLRALIQLEAERIIRRMSEALQYLLGAGIVGVLVTQFVTSVRRWRARRRERDGLLRLLYTEIVQNGDIIDYVISLVE